MRKLLLLASVTTLAALLLNAANAQVPFGFRLLNLDGGTVAWNSWVGETKFTKVSYAFVKSRTDTPDATNCNTLVPMDALLEKSRVAKDDFRKEVRAAFDMWEAAANITFTEVDDPAKAGVLIGAQAQPKGRAFANVAYKPSLAGGARSIERSLICLNPDQRWKIGFDGNLTAYDLRYTIAHEIGHAIGLDHPPGTGQLMHYRYEERFRTLQPGDIEGAVLLYGPPASRQTVTTVKAAPAPVVTPTPTPVTVANDPILAKAAARAAEQKK